MELCLNAESATQMAHSTVPPMSCLPRHNILQALPVMIPAFSSLALPGGWSAAFLGQLTPTTLVLIMLLVAFVYLWIQERKQIKLQRTELQSASEQLRKAQQALASRTAKMTNTRIREEVAYQEMATAALHHRKTLAIASSLCCEESGVLLRIVLSGHSALEPIFTLLNAAMIDNLKTFDIYTAAMSLSDAEAEAVSDIPGIDYDDNPARSGAGAAALHTLWCCCTTANSQTL